MAEYKPLRPIQPVSLPSFQYGLANVKVGRSKYQDLADALSQINPALQQFGRISRAKQQLIEQKQEEDRLAREAEIAKGREAFQLDPSGVSEQLKNLTRKGLKAGVIPDGANAPFIIGGLQAQGEVLVNRDYRDQLRSLVETTNDPEVAIAQTKAEFLKRPEFSDPSVRAYAAEVFDKVDDEFRKDVNNRLDKVRTESNKRAWLELGRPVVGQVIKGQLDVTDPNMIGWINHAAGVFEGSHKFAWDNLIKEDLKEGLTTGEYTPTAVLDFVEDLRELNLGGGIKFADAETGNAISDFVNYVEDKRAALENKAKENINIQFEEVKFDATDVFLDEFKETGTVSKDTLMAQIDRAVELVPHHKRDQLIADIQGSWANTKKLRDEATKVVFDDFVRDIEEGRDLDTIKEDINKAVDSGSITASEYDKLNTRLENSRDFDVQIIKSPSYIDLKNSYEDLITGYRRDKKLLGDIDPNTIKNYFSTITVSKDVPDELNGVNSLYTAIKKKKGEAKAKMFVNRQYRSFDRLLRNKLELEFNKQIGLGRTIEQAKQYIDENQDTIAEKEFESWVDASITLAETTYLR